MRKLILLFAAVIALIAASPSVAATGVSITKTGFSPSDATVAAGGRVTWTNNDTANHQIVANDGSFSSAVLAPKQSYSHTFSSTGSNAYHDAIDPSLKGTVTVVPDGQVSITKDGFVPAETIVNAGDTVTWTNKDTANHQVVGNGGGFSSPVLASGQSYTHTFLLPGTRAYHDGLQPSSKGSVIVTAVVVPPAQESITLTGDKLLVVYGRTTTLAGRIDNGTAGERVTITAKPQLAGKVTQSTQVVTAGADGSFSAVVQPLVHTTYVASTDKSRSDAVAINVAPKLGVGFLSRTRFIFRATAARSLVGKYGLLQKRIGRVWVSMRRIYLARATYGPAQSVVSSATVRLHLRHGLSLRVLMPLGQTVPGYVSASSNTTRS